MREILYQSHKNAGRSGHQLKDLFTSVILAKLLNGRAVRSRFWNYQSLFSQENVGQVLSRPESGIPQVNFCRPRKFWRGIDWKEFLSFQSYFNSLPDRCRISISGVYRIHLCQVKNWEDAGRIENGQYDALIEDLRSLYWGSTARPVPSKTVRNIVIHARRKWGASFYQEKIDILRSRYPEASIRLLTEIQGSADLDDLVGAEIDKGGTNNLKAHFKEMVTADLLVPACSSFSTWAAYLTEGLVATSPDYRIKHFQFANPPASHIAI